MISTRSLAVIGATAVTITALILGQDGFAITAFFGFLAGIGMANGSQNNSGQS